MFNNKKNKTMEIMAFTLTFFAGMALDNYMITKEIAAEEKQRMKQLLKLEGSINQLRHLKDAYKNNQCTCTIKLKQYETN